jgi:glycosyltransferase involved in cell wall biosynthesis
MIEGMRILQVISSFPPAYSYGGPLKFAFELSKELVKKNHDVTVYTTDVFDSNSRLKYNTNPEIMDGIQVYRFRNISNALCRIHFSCAPTMFFSLKNKIRDFDIIHLHEYRSFQAMCVQYWAKKYHIPYIVQAHGAVLPFFEKQNLKKIYDFVGGRKVLENAATCVALTNTESDQYISMGVSKNKIAIIPNGIENSQYSDLPPRGQFRSKYHIFENERIILSLGRIHKIKGIDLLVAAFSQLCNQTNNVKLVIAGPDGGSLAQIQQQVRELHLENNVIFTGPLYGNDKIEAYIDADVFVLPSRHEAFPMTVLEAWACGTPVIATNNCCISDIIRYTDDNIIVEFDPVHMKEKILELLNNDEKRKEIGKKGKKLVRDNFDITQIVQKVEGVYETI